VKSAVRRGDSLSPLTARAALAGFQRPANRKIAGRVVRKARAEGE